MVANLNFANGLDTEAKETIRDMFEYHKWNELQVAQGGEVCEALMKAVEVIVEHVPASPDRSAAIRKLREARMDCNSAITHGGKY